MDEHYEAWGIFNEDGVLIDCEEYLEVFITESVALERIVEIEEINEALKLSFTVKEVIITVKES